MPRSAEGYLRRQALWYGLPGFVLTLLGVPLYVYLPNYLHEHWEVGLGVIGVALLATRLLDMLTDPLVGAWSDQRQRRLSRRGQMLLGAGVLLPGLYGLFFPVDAWLQAQPFWYLWGVGSVTFLGWTLMSVPYQALVNDATMESSAKTQLTLSREGFGIVGVVFVLALPTLLSEAPTAQVVFEWTFWTVGLALIVSLLALSRLRLPAANVSSTVAHSGFVSSLSDYRHLWHGSPGAYRLMGPYFLNNLANAFPATLFLLFVNDALALSSQAGLLLLVYFASGLLALPFWLWLSKRVGKLAAWRSSILLAVIGFFGLYWVESGDFETYLLVCVVTGLSLGADMALPASLQADVVQRLREQGQDVASRLFGLWGFLTKLALALAVGLALPLLDFLGIGSQAAIATIALWGFYAFVPVLLKVIVLIWLMKSFQKCVIEA
ncbi:MFS transporter [Thiomicrospira sp. WB1]|uniref:MFS transporter n=1 Tax=Thiomicrospira sp. WB1 TaxID=1685380 RepID=UPI0007488106|nr:MFS transporter [Thiomicrospira sp. WB1]KUJ72489.1 hypothetical protein AVO41_01365 [Thiomicrospira sp. WB1]